MERRAVNVRGIVQGVGFRPFVYRLAEELQLCGFVRNEAGAVRIEIEGALDSLERFREQLLAQRPPLAQIEDFSWERMPLRQESRFRIESSAPAESTGGPLGPAEQEIFVAPDLATCDECLAELFDPADRRFGYPFLNCTNCGPRLTVVTAAPYDRSNTTMAGFPLCAACRAEYDDPQDRRFHAQPIACPECGPQLRLLNERGECITADDPLRSFADALRRGQIGALKGLGGYHLVCDARNETAVAELRRRKQRDEKPLAIMVADAEDAAQLCDMSAAEWELLRSPRRPIVLLRKRWGIAGGRGVAEGVAPGNPWLGVTLPYTPLHHLLARAVGRIPLVMTSGNRSDEPIACADDDALQRLGGIADVFLTHDRPIRVRCDDSVTRIVAGAELLVRRSRGDAPRPIALPRACRRLALAVGGQFKATFALGRGRSAFLSHHLGDLDHLAAYRAFTRDIELYEALFATRPELIVHDLHPDYASTRYARDRAAAEGLPVLAVQHHHAHVASCLAEHGLEGPAIGVAFDGTGYGTDGAVWGGEFLIADLRGFRRAAHLRYVGLPGGEQAIRQPWRMAVSHLVDAGCDGSSIQLGATAAELRTVARMLERRLNTPLTSSVGRLFDAVAALLGVRQRVSYEGQAAEELEWLATGVTADGAYPWAGFPDPAEKRHPIMDGSGKPSHEPFFHDAPWTIDTRPLIRALVADVNDGVDRRLIARRFHSAMVELVATVCCLIREETRLDQVALSGGVFLNAILAQEVPERLAADGFRVYRHRLVPAGDGGLSLGQLAVAAATMSDVAVAG